MKMYKVLIGLIGLMLCIIVSGLCGCVVMPVRGPRVIHPHPVVVRPVPVPVMIVR